MKKNLFILLLFYNSLFAQTVEIIPSSTSVANASVAESNYSLFHNPSILSLVGSAEFQFAFESRYLLKELAIKSAGVLVPTKLVDVALVTSYTGFSLYNEFLAGIVFARDFNHYFRIGVQYNYYSVYFAESNKRASVLFPQIGMQAEISPVLTLGFTAFNPAQQTLKSEFSIKQMPSLFNFGVNWHPSDDFKMLFQFDKNISGAYRIAGGFDYKMKNFIAVKTGAYYSEYLVPSLGFDLDMNRLQFKLMTDIHPVLGLSSRAAISYQLSKR